MDTSQNLDRVHEYYCAPRTVNGRELTIYDIWEEGGAFNDSITPSTYSPEYRSHMLLKLLGMCEPEDTVFSIGCGNGVIEGDLVAHKQRVVGIDCNNRAIELARNKGVHAYVADFFSLTAEALAGVSVIYADGLLGHLFHPKDGLGLVFTKLKALSPKPGTWLVLSNDAPRQPGVPYAPHEHVEDFWFISRDYLSACLTDFGFRPLEAYYFPYIRPISGLRNRTLCVASMP